MIPARSTVHELIHRLFAVAICLAVAMLVGLLLPRVHYVVSIGVLILLSLAFLFLAKIEVGVMGLILFAPMVDILGRIIPLPMGANAFNLLFAMLVFILLGQYTITKRWPVQLWEPRVGLWIYLVGLGLLVAALRAYFRPDAGTFVDVLDLASRKSIVTSQFVKPFMYMAMFFIAYNFARTETVRRQYMVVMGISLMIYVLTMALQFAGVFPLFSTQWGKAAGGVLGASNTLGHLLAYSLVMFAAVSPYFNRGLKPLFAWSIASMCVGAMLFTLSRTAWVLAGVGSLLLALTVPRWTIKLAAIMIVAVALLTTPFWAPERIREYWYETTTARADDPNAVLSGRVQIWTAAAHYLASDPVRFLTGGGAMDFRYRGPEYGLKQGFHAHHVFVEVLVNQGVIGLLLMIAMFGAIYRHLLTAWRHGLSPESRQLGRLLTIVTTLLILSGTEPYDRIASWYWFWLGMFVASLETPPPSTSTPAPARVNSWPRTLRSSD